MKHVKKALGKAVGVLAILAVVPVSGWTFGGPHGGGWRQGPPQEAIDACAGKKAGDAVTFTAPCGDNVSAVCREFGDRLVAAPGRGRGMMGPGRGREGDRPCGMKGARREGRGMGHGRFFGRMASELELTAEQRGKVRAIMDEERGKAQPLRKQIAENRDQLRRLAEKEPFDETAVRTLAASQEKTRIDLAVSRARAMNRIHAVLTPQQREKAEKLGPMRGNRPDCPLGK